MKYFTISEFLFSERAIAKKIWNGANREVEDNLIALVSAILDPLREKYGKPITVSSGYRCRALNNVTPNASRTSQHLTGEAADITVKSKNGNRQLAKMIIDMGLPFDQMIDECNYDWVHVSYKRVGNNRRQILRYKNKSYTNIDAKEL